jgi:hypothetical protein
MQFTCFVFIKPLNLNISFMKNGFLKIGFFAVLLWAVLIIAGCPRGAQRSPGGSSDTSGAPIKPGS